MLLLLQQSLERSSNRTSSWLNPDLGFATVEFTILHAIVFLIAPKIDHKLHDSVYSYRLAKDWKKRARKASSLFSHADVANIPFLKRRTLRSINIEEPWYTAWPELMLKA